MVYHVDMEKPECRLCGDRHYGLCGGKPGFVQVKTWDAEPVISPPPIVIPVQGSRHGAYKDMEKRNKYRREWARKKRLEI